MHKCICKCIKVKAMPTKKDDILKCILMLSIDFIIKKHLLNNNSRCIFRSSPRLSDPTVFLKTTRLVTVGKGTISHAYSARTSLTEPTERTKRGKLWQFGDWDMSVMGSQHGKHQQEHSNSHKHNNATHQAHLQSGLWESHSTLLENTCPEVRLSVSHGRDLMLFGIYYRYSRNWELPKPPSSTL